MESSHWDVQALPKSEHGRLLDWLAGEATDHAVMKILSGGVDVESEVWAASRRVLGQQKTPPDAVAIIQWHPGQTASLVGPWATENRAGHALVAGLIEAAADRQNVLLQSLTELDTGETPALLRAAGFNHAADLVYLVSLPGSFPDEPPTTSLHFESLAVSTDDRLEKIIAATYEGSHDCPQLNDVRRMTDVVAGYRSTGEHEPQLWFLAVHEGQDIGCLLLTPHAAFGNLEIVYFGIVPAARGRGFGFELVRRAQWIGAQRGAARVVLAVDAANEPAMRVYSEAGFVAWDRRTVWVRLLDPQAQH